MPRILSRSQMPMPAARRRSSLVPTGFSRRNSLVGAGAVSHTSSPKGHGSSPAQHRQTMGPTKTCGESSVSRCHQQLEQQYFDSSFSDSTASFATALTAAARSIGSSSSRVAPNDSSNDSRRCVSGSTVAPSRWQRGIFGFGASTASRPSTSSSDCTGNGSGSNYAASYGQNHSGTLSAVDNGRSSFPGGVGGGFLPTSGLTRNTSSGYGHYVEVAEDF